jgi:hypothetical protein
MLSYTSFAEIGKSKYNCDAISKTLYVHNRMNEAINEFHTVVSCVFLQYFIVRTVNSVNTKLRQLNSEIIFLRYMCNVHFNSVLQIAHFMHEIMPLVGFLVIR